jgi:sugar/nucleoside kinase (ribokinase family)
VEAAEALVFASNTLVGPEREVTLRARGRALELGRPVCFDPNLRLERWPSAEERSRRRAAASRAACSSRPTRTRRGC